MMSNMMYSKNLRHIYLCSLLNAKNKLNAAQNFIFLHRQKESLITVLQVRSPVFEIYSSVFFVKFQY